MWVRNSLSGGGGAGPPTAVVKKKDSPRAPSYNFGDLPPKHAITQGLLVAISEIVTGSQTGASPAFCDLPAKAQH